MAIIIEPSKGKAPQIDDGLYPVTCRGVRAVTVDSDAFQNFEKVELTIEVEDLLNEEGEPVTLDPRCNRKWGEKATLYQWALAFGVVASVNESFDAEEFDGRQAMALIETPEDGGWPRVTKFSKRTVKANGVKAPTAAQEGAEPPLADALTEAAALANWFEEIKSIGYSTKEILDHATGKYGKTPKDMTAAERDALAKELTGVPF